MECNRTLEAQLEKKSCTVCYSDILVIGVVCSHLYSFCVICFIRLTAENWDRVVPCHRSFRLNPRPHYQLYLSPASKANSKGEIYCLFFPQIIWKVAKQKSVLRLVIAWAVLWMDLYFLFDICWYNFNNRVYMCINRKCV